jgi:hypothetical protein
VYSVIPPVTTLLQPPAEHIVRLISTPDTPGSTIQNR